MLTTSTRKCLAIICVALNTVDAVFCEKLFYAGLSNKSFLLKHWAR
ncbi:MULTISPECIES: hypothetical protein [unclassified Gilliamella]|nr:MULTISPECIES: hypothetical protein [unclassified Gilliamella]MCX8662828.1 hypothetical protein [Gilliamella sp. B2911]QYN42454.1 hypothetical protein GYM76_06680 [Gilliamella sp. ESL0443]